jgi:hypothetical protein
MRIEDVEGLVVMQETAGITDRGAFAGFELVPGQYTARALAKGKEVAAADIVVRGDPLRVILTPR